MLRESLNSLVSEGTSDCTLGDGMQTWVVYMLTMTYIFFSAWGIDSVAVPRNYLLGTNSLRLQNISNCIGQTVGKMGSHSLQGYFHKDDIRRHDLNSSENIAIFRIGDFIRKRSAVCRIYLFKRYFMKRKLFFFCPFSLTDKTEF